MTVQELELMLPFEAGIDNSSSTLSYLDADIVKEHGIKPAVGLRGSCLLTNY